MTTTTSPEKMRKALHAATEKTRWSILVKLAEEPMTTGQLSKALRKSPQHILWHIRSLTSAGLVRAVKKKSEYADKPVQVFHLVPQSYVMDLKEAVITTV